MSASIAAYDSLPPAMEKSFGCAAYTPSHHAALHIHEPQEDGNLSG